MRNEADGVRIDSGKLPRMWRTIDDRGQVQLAVLPDFPDTPGAPPFVRPALTAEQDIEKPARAPRRLAIIGGTLAVMAAGVFLVLMPEPSPVPTKPLRVRSAPAVVAPLPLADLDFSVCLPADEPQPNRPAPAVATPTRRKASKAQFLDDTDSVIIKRKGKPDVVVTVTELKEGSKPSQDPQSRAHTIDARDVAGTTVEIGIGQDLRMSMDFEQ